MRKIEENNDRNESVLSLVFLDKKPWKLDKIFFILLPWTYILSAGTLCVGLYYVFLESPPDYKMGDSVRIMYIHVPSSWIAIASYALMAISSIVSLVWKSLLFEIFVKSLSPVGTCFCLVSIITGSIWGRPMWGTWWVWDARLVSMSVLLIFYVGYHILISSFRDQYTSSRAGQYLIIIGAINLPVIRWSVDWWSTLHQPSSILLLSGSSIHQSFMVPLFMMNTALIFTFFLLFFLRFRLEIRKYFLNQNRYVFSS